MFFPKRSKIQKSQRGFTLVAVLILSGLASILVLSSIKDNVNQERLSGNFQKKINARLMSERGIFDAMAEAKRYLDNNPTADVNELAANIVDRSKEDSTGLTNGQMKYKVQLAADGDELVLSSTGNRFEGQSTLKVRLKIVPASGGSAPFSSAIVGCDSVNLTGSGQIDSYNSGEAPYDESSPGTEGNVTTINKDGGDVTLGGGSPVYGDISATGKIDTNSSKVVGNLHANGDITLGENSNPVSGYVLTRGNYLQDGGDVGGYVRANGNAEMDWSTNILNNQDQGYDIQYGGQGTFKNTYNEKYEAAIYNVNPNVAKVKDSDSSVANYDASDPATNCDYLDIASVVTAISPNTSPLPDFTSRGSGGDTYTYDVTGLSGIKTSTWVEGQEEVENFDFSPEMATVFGNSLSVVKLSSFHLKGDNILNISGDTTLFVDGNFTMDGATKITIAADSSLTLIVTGIVDLLAGAKITANQQGLTASGLPAMSIYSSYNSDNENKAGIKINGAFETYAQIYAPLADVIINGSGTLYGAVRGKTVAVKGGAKIHYDAALGATNQGNNGSSQQARLQFAGFEY
jgi:cytoskeletal protein CcmA (bactofilin family)